MTDTSTQSSPPAQPPQRERFRHTKSFFRWLFGLPGAAKNGTVTIIRWMRDRDSEAARHHYVRFGIWTSRLYAVLLIPVVALVALVAPSLSPEKMLWVTLIWCAVWSHLYLWYQGKQIIAYPVVETEHADQDLMNSVIPAISIGILIALWFVVMFFHYMAWMQFEFSYTIYGWIIIFNAIADVVYDLRVNTKVTLNLSKVPGRLEFKGSQAAHE